MSRFFTGRMAYGDGYQRIDLSTVIAIGYPDYDETRKDGVVGFAGPGGHAVMLVLKPDDGDTWMDALNKLLTQWERSRVRAGRLDVDATR